MCQKGNKKREGLVFKQQRILSAFSLQLPGNSRRNVPRSPTLKAASENVRREKVRGCTCSFETHLLNCRRILINPISHASLPISPSLWDVPQRSRNPYPFKQRLRGEAGALPPPTPFSHTPPEIPPLVATSSQDNPSKMDVE